MADSCKTLPSILLQAIVTRLNLLAMMSHLADTTSCLNWQNCSSHVPSGSNGLVGWVRESPGRGTFTLVWACLLTIFLCTWVVIHPRIDNRRRFRILHKLALSLKTLIAPEFIAVEGAQEWTQARRVVKSCISLTGEDFKLIQAFYIGMLGIRYRTPCGTRVLWPNQFIWLLEQGLVKWENQAEWNMTLASIKDRSNADGTAKVFALFQVGWFVAQCIIRTAHSLPLAPFESMTLGYIPLFALTYFFWWIKPKDIETPSEIDLPTMSEDQKRTFESMSVSDDFDDERAERETSLWSIWYLTPRIFEKEAKDRRIQQAMQDTEQHIQRLRDRGLPVLRRAKALSSKPAEDVVLAHWDPDLYHSKLWPVTCLFGMSFPALHLLSWDGTFPTVFELWLWRGAAITSICSMLVFMHFERVVVRWRDPWTLVKVFTPALYLVSRVVMLAEAMAAFRASNPAVYETYVVWNY